MARQGLISILSLVICCYGLYQCFQHELPPHLIKGGHFQFLTNISLSLTILYILQSILTPTSPYLRTQYNIVSNLEFTVTVCYWTLQFILPHFLNPKSQVHRDWSIDLAIHFWPYLYLLVFDSQDRIRAKKSWSLTAAVIVVYWCYIERIVSVNNDGITAFAYPFLNNKTLTERFLWMLLIWFISCLNYYIIGFRNML